MKFEDLATKQEIDDLKSLLIEMRELINKAPAECPEFPSEKEVLQYLLRVSRFKFRDFVLSGIIIPTKHDGTVRYDREQIRSQFRADPSLMKFYKGDKPAG